MAKHYRMLVSIAGTFEGIEGGVKRGDIVELNDTSAKRYLASGYIETETNPKVEVGQPYGQQTTMVKTSGLRSMWDGWGRGG